MRLLTTKEANELYSQLTGKQYAKNHNIVQKLISHGYVVLTGDNGRSVIREQDVIALSTEPDRRLGHNKNSQITISKKPGKFVKVDYGRCRQTVIDKWHDLGIKDAAYWFDLLLGEQPT